jgi:hypothetical protein
MAVVSSAGKNISHLLSLHCAVPPAGIGAGFYLGYSWLPSFFVKHVGIPQSLTLWMVLSGMVIFTFVVPVSSLPAVSICKGRHTCVALVLTALGGC